ncbi:MAG: hypothetical protein HS126_04560 [Anaerolineales bacterium]|nr:hypothetical protein [Anaerolineales bacterium]
MTSNSNNPYVGPRTFTRQESDRFFGREREARELFSLVVSERLVLFYAQSGAGKSSLLNTRLIPQLQAAGFAVLPTGRVSGELPQSVAEVGNIFAFNLMLSLDQSSSDPQQFADLPLTNFLAGLVSDDGEHYRYESEAEGYVSVPHVLIIDQFEEIITTHPRHWPQREDFFRQLDRAMADDPLLWVVLTFREDYLAALEPYAPLLAGNMRARFYMQRMERDAALEAVKKPAQQGGRSFAPGVAESLVDNLRQIRVEGQAQIQLGQFIEPVQLQVVCFQLWENLKARPTGEITQADLQELGNVDRALADFYEQALTKAVAATGQSELELRDWFERKLITEAGTRGSVYRGKDSTGGISTRTTDFLVNQFVLRTESRAGGIWYELVHDRFIEPILQANKAWRGQQPLLVQMAEAWVNSGESMSQLLEGQQLQEALRTSRPDIQRLGFVKKFIEASQTAQQAKEAAQQAEKLQQAQTLAEAAHRRAEAEAKAARRLRWIIAALAVTLAVLLGLAGVAVYAFIQRQEVIISHEAITTLLSLDGRLYISVAPDDRTVRLVDTANQEVLLTLTGHTAEISKITLNPNANYLATADHGGTTIIWDLNTGQAVARLTGHSDTIRYMVFSHDGRWVATGGDDGTTRLWETSTWQQTHVFNSDGAPIISVAFWPDDSFLVTATTDKKYTIWNPRTGEKVLDGSQ